MTFLAPMPAIIAAAVALPALLALYFLKLRRRPVRVGSTMLWRAAAEDLQANVPLRWIRPSLLLLLQLLVLACLLLALARPAVNTDGEMPGRVFLLVDRSASMRATDMPDGATRFERAVELAKNAVERVSAGGSRSEMTLIAFAADAEIVAGPTRSTGEMLRALDNLTPTDQPGDPAAALRLVRGLAGADEEEAERGPGALVVVCSDGSVAGPLPVVSGPVRFERSGPEEVGGNIGVVALAARRDHANPTKVRVFARLESNLDEPESLGITVRLDGEVVVRQAVEARPADTSGPGQTPLALELSAPDAELLAVRVEREDALASDDAASLWLPAPRRPAVLLVREREDEQAGTGWLLTDVLRELDLSALTLMSADRVSSLGATAYEGVDLAVFDGVSAQGVPPVASVHFGGSPELPGMAYADSDGRVLPVLSWERSDPLLRDLSLDAVRVGRGALLAAADDEASFTELARTAEGVVLARIDIGGVPHVVSGFELVQSTWPVDYSLAIFLANAVETLPRAGAMAAGWSTTTSEPARPPVAIAEGVTLTGPGGETREVLSSGAGPRLGVLEFAGVWRADGLAIPVNLFDSRESSLESPSSLALPGGEAAGARGAIAGEPREVWPWFVLAAAVLLGVEWLLFGARARV